MKEPLNPQLEDELYIITHKLIQGHNHYDIIVDEPKHKTLPLAINSLVKNEKIDTNLISDGYHTFGELYEHRIQLWITLCNLMMECGEANVWRSGTMSDGSKWDGWFLLGIGDKHSKQITYHLPMSKWCDCDFAETLTIAPDFDGHTSEDVLQRLKNL